MIRDWLPILIASTLMLLGCSPLSPEIQVIHDAGDAMGGVDHVLETENIVLQGSGRQYRLGQNQDPDDELPYWEVEDYVRKINPHTPRWNLTNRRTSTFLTGNPAFGQEQNFGLDGDVAYNIGTDGAARRAAAGVARDRLTEHYHHPLTLTCLALAEGSIVSNLRQEGDQDVLDITSAVGDTYTMYIEISTKLPNRIVSMAYNTNLGDVTLTTEFDDYQETSGLGGFQTRLTLPRRISSRIDGWPMWDLRVEAQVNQQIGDVSAPEEARSVPAPEFQANVRIEEVTDGVWLLGGQSHHSVLIEFADYLALFEAPQNDTRALAVIEQARNLRPDKTLQYLINSHHHFDHSGGVRAAVSEGLTIITHEDNADFFRDLVVRPHTIQQDALTRFPNELTLELVTGDAVYELSDGSNALQLVRILDDAHSSSILMGYLPRERLMIEADAFSPNSRAAPFAANLLKNVRGLDWRVDRIVPIHGGVSEFATLEETVENETRNP